MPPLPGWYPFGPDEDKPAPQPLLLVQAFLNTHDFEKDRDLLADPEEARRWLISAGLLAKGSGVSPPELETARAVRGAIRSLVEGDRHLAPLRRLADAHRPRLVVQKDGTMTLEPEHREGVGDALYQLLLIIRSAQEEGTFARLKACSNPECRWVFYDRSRNRQGQWCEMAVCGNRLKNRTLRARQRRDSSSA